jgi:hypothetical protein
MIEFFALIGVLTTGVSVLFVHEILKSSCRTYRRICLDAWDWLTLPYLICKAYRYSEKDLIKLRDYTRRAKQRPPIAVMRLIVERFCKRHGYK